MNRLMKRFLSTICLVAFSACLAFAQTNTVKHTVERGETLTSIAKRYATTEEKLIELNPNAAQFVYVGMELIIPNVQKREQTSERIVHTYSSNTANYYSEEALLQTRDKEYNASDFTFYGISYLAPFDNADKGYYMIGGEFFSDRGWGGDLQLGFNYGLVDKDYAGCAFLLGPAYGYAYNNVLISASLDFIGTYSSAGKSAKTGTNAKGEEYSYLGTDSKFNWGIALMPKAVIKLGRVMPWLGVNVQWAKGADKLSLGFQVGIGFDF